MTTLGTVGWDGSAYRVKLTQAGDDPHEIEKHLQYQAYKRLMERARDRAHLAGLDYRNAHFIDITRESDLWRATAIYNPQAQPAQETSST